MCCRTAFRGRGELPNHLPEIRPTGSTWNIISGSFASLDGSGISGYQSGSNGAAVIDTGINDFDLSARIKTGSGGEEIGVILRGAAGLGTYIRASLNSGTDQAKLTIYGSGAGVLSGTIPLEDETFYTIRALGWGKTIRLYVDGIYACGNDGNASPGTCAGLSTLQGSARTVLGLDPGGTINKHEWKRITLIGDSITAANPGWVSPMAQSYHEGLTKPFNHAYPGARAGESDFSNQIDETHPNDNMDFTIILLGTNDSSDFTQNYKAQLIHLWSLWPGKPIYALGILNRSPDNTRDTVNGWIASAVAQAQAEGVEVTYWNTDGWIDAMTDTSDGIHPNEGGECEGGELRCWRDYREGEEHCLGE